jgi:hypothetical protein
LSTSSLSFPILSLNFSLIYPFHLGSPVSLQPALDLMAKYSAYLDTPRALALLPSDLPLDKIKGYLKAVLRDTASKRRNAQVLPLK